MDGHKAFACSGWNFHIYLLTRMSTLIFLILLMIGTDSPTHINCQSWIVFELILTSLAFVAASSLIVLRVIAIWDKNLFAVTISMLAWSTNVAFFIHYTAKIHAVAVWGSGQRTCSVQNAESGNTAFFTILVTDVVLLLTMLSGLLRLRQHGTMFALGHLLWKQGLIWLFLATVAEVPPVVFLILNLNGPFDIMFQPSALVVMSIAATRMHRSLTNFTHRNTFDTHQTRGRGHMPVANADAKQIVEVQPSLEVEVVVHASTEGCPPS